MSETAVAERQPKVRRDYTDQEINAGLTAMAICSGHRERAHKLLKAEGITVPATTLSDWTKRSRQDQYERIRQEIAPKIQAQMADTQQALAQDAAELEAKALIMLHQQMDSGALEAKDAANIYKNAGIIGAVHVDKAQLLNERPTQIVQRDLSETLRELKGIGLEIQAEVISEETVA